VAQTEDYIERRIAALQSAPRKGKRTFILKDVRLFLNSIDRGVHMMKEAGVHARTEREETEEEILLTIRIPKGRN
jgi:ParB family chromosome partitioning protein